MLVVFSPIFVLNTKITFVYNFVAPLSLIITSYLEYKTDEQLNYFEITENDILSIIKNLMQVKLMGGAKYRLNYAVKQQLFHYN